MNTISKLVAATVLILSVGAGPPPVYADTDLHPSKCRQAWLNPEGHRAELCRARGWVVWKRLVVTPRLVVTHYAIPTCKTRYPDGNLDKPVRPLPCYYGFGGPQDEPMFYVTRNRQRHHVNKAR